MKNNRLIVILITCAILAGCASEPHFAPVDVKAAPPSHKILHHIVAPSETLYSIAWRYNLDVKRLASANNVENTYTIYPGQRLTLDLSNVRTRGKTSSVKPAAVKVARKKTAIKKRRTPVTRSTNTTAPVKKTSSSRPANVKTVWRWPCKCRLVATFRGAHSLQKGIDLKANLGEPIHAAAAGNVVYSGDGLRGYGKLLIVKHSEVLLSAYAHNQKLLVKEGETVRAGQVIAKMGKTGTTSVKLHFEVRLDGKPVDPLKYLPGKTK